MCRASRRGDGSAQVAVAEPSRSVAARLWLPIAAPGVWDKKLQVRTIRIHAPETRVPLRPWL